jgi:hypothetical protein
MPRPRNTKSTKQKKTHHFQYNCTLFSSRHNTKPHTNQKKQKDFQKKKKKTSAKTESKNRKPEGKLQSKERRDQKTDAAEKHTSK